MDNKNFLIKSSIYFSIINALLIFMIKIYLVSITNAMVILSSAIDSFLDVGTSLINLMAIRMAMSPNSSKYRFGKNRAEDLAVFVQSIFFICLGIFVIISSTNRIFDPQDIKEQETGIKGILISLTLTSLLVIYQKYVIYKTASKIIEVDKLHYITDFFRDLITLIPLFLGSEYIIIDPILSILIGAYLIHNSYTLFKNTFGNLIDMEIDDEQREQILSIISEYKEYVHGVHDFKTRYAGDKLFMQFHVEISGDKTLNEVHQISDRIMNSINAKFKNAEIIIHSDPAGISEKVEYIDKKFN